MQLVKSSRKYRLLEAAQKVVAMYDRPNHYPLQRVKRLDRGKEFFPMNFDLSDSRYLMEHHFEAAKPAIQKQYENEFSNNWTTRFNYIFKEPPTYEGQHMIYNRPIPKSALQDMMSRGYHIMNFGNFYWEHVLEALYAYQATFGHVDVPYNFTISNAKLKKYPLFSSKLVGMNLGECVMQIRIGDADGLECPHRRPLLDKLNFNWGDKSKYLRFRFPAMVIGMRMYYMWHGDLEMDDDFVVPKSPYFPIWLYKAPLGEWMSWALLQRGVLEKHYPDRLDILKSLTDFPWWIPRRTVPNMMMPLP